MMNNTLKTILLAALLCLVLLAALRLYPVLQARFDASAPTTEQQEAADFTVYDSQGNAVSLSDFQGEKPLVLNFWASWCGSCKIALPNFQSAYETYGDQVQFLMINLCAYGNDDPEEALALIDEAGYTFPVYFDTDGSAMESYAVRSLPLSCFISRSGIMVYQQLGPIPIKKLPLYIEQLLEEE